MGLDWNPGNRPKPGYETEFYEIFHELEDRDEFSRPSAFAWLGKLLGRRVEDRQARERALLNRYEEISQTAFETLAAPRVGYDEAATQYARQTYAENQLDKPLEEWLEDVKGFYIVSLVENCDGVPHYSNGSPGGYVEPFSFRAQFLKDCTDIVGEDLLEDAYVSKTADEMLAYGRALLQKAEDYAKQRDIDLHQLVRDDDFESDEFKLDVVLAAGRWCVFWGERRHILDAYW